MIYFKKNNDIIEKYQVNFNKEEIEKLKYKIIDNCSYIEHKEYSSDIPPRFTNRIIKNLKSSYTGESKEYFEERRDIYLYSYDEYNPPYLVELMDLLLCNDSWALERIFKYNISTKSSIDDRINSVNQELSEINPEDINQKKSKLEELEKLLNNKKLNKDQQSIEPYYNQLIELIIFNLIDSISISELERMESFLETNLSSKIEKPFAIVKSLKIFD